MVVLIETAPCGIRNESGSGAFRRRVGLLITGCPCLTYSNRAVRPPHPVPPVPLDTEPGSHTLKALEARAPLGTAAPRCLSVTPALKSGGNMPHPVPGQRRASVQYNVGAEGVRANNGSEGAAGIQALRMRSSSRAHTPALTPPPSPRGHGSAHSDYPHPALRGSGCPARARCMTGARLLN